MKILIVEDNPVNYRLLQKILEEYGDCEVAVNGKEGLIAYEKSCADNDPIDLIFLDIKMPEMNGHELLALIRKDEERRGVAKGDQVKVVIESIVSSQESIFKGFDAGALFYFVKPYGTTELESLVKELGLVKKAERQ
ncbi:MAG: response regulator [SAR324 cluster bacterium]|nr:response regulator [SAR324 cluster bacterium]